MVKAKKKFKINPYIIILAILLIILLAIFLTNYFSNKNKDIGIKTALNTISVDTTQITEKKTERMLKLEELQNINNEIIAWLDIPETKISYPVLHGKDNSYYMTRNYKREYSKDGSLFLDKDYNWNLPSTNLLIYGHNNKNGTMFDDLMNYKKEAFYKKHPIIKLTTNNEDVEYEIIAVFLSKVYYKSDKNVFRYYYFINAKTEEEFNYYIENSKKSALYDTGKTAKYGDQLLTLSTCSYHTEDGRLAVVARKINNL